MKNVNFFNFGAKGTANSGGGNSRLFFKSAILLLILTLGFGQVWGVDVTIAQPTNPGSTMNNISYGLFILSHNNGAAYSSGAIKAANNGDEVTITLTTTKSDMYIKSVEFESPSNGSITSDDGTKSGNVFTITGNKNSVAIKLKSNSNAKGSVKFKQAVINSGSNDLEAITFSSYTTSTKAFAFSSSSATSALTSITQSTNKSPSVSSNILSWPNQGDVVFTSSRKIQYIALLLNDAKNYTAFKETNNSGDALTNHVWTGNSNAVTIYNGTGGGRSIKNVYVVFAPSTYTLAWNLDGGSVDVAGTAAGSYTAGTTITAPTVSKTGYAFNGWDPAVPATMPAANSEYTATWTPSVYSVTLHTNDGTINSGNVSSYTFGVGATLPTDVSKASCDFAGWYTDNGVWSDGPYITIANDATGNKEYWAKWTAEAPKHSINYTNDKGATPVAALPTQYAQGTGIASFPALNDVEGFHFTGWSPSSISSSATTDQVIEAQWVPIYNVSFNSNGGSAVDAQHVASGGTATAPDPAPTRTNWTFQKWQLNGVDYNFSTAVTESITLDAVWSRNSISGAENDFVIINGTTVNTGGTLSVGHYFSAGTANSHVKYAGAIGGGNGCRFTTFTLPTGSSAVVKEAVVYTAKTFVIIPSSQVSGIDFENNTSSGCTISYADPYFSLTGASGGKNQTEASVSTTIPAGTYYCGSTGSGLEIGKLTLTVTTSPITITFKNGEATYATITATSGEKLGNLFLNGELPTLVAAGYTFNGWKDKDDNAVSKTTAISASMTIHADWTASTYNLTLSAGENALTAGAGTVQMGASAITIGTATTGTGALKGFYTTSDGNVKVAEADGALVSGNVTDYVTGGKWSRTSDTELFAQYAPSYDVKFFPGYGENTQIGGTQSIAGGNFAVAPADPEREGYAFQGWSYDATAAHIVTVGSYAISGATNFTAIWKQEFKVKYYDGITKLGEETVVDGESPTHAGDFDEKAYCTFDGWFSDADLAPAHAIADVAALVISENTNIYSKWIKSYAQSIDLEQFVIDNKKTGNWHAYLDSKNFTYTTEGDLSLDSLNPDKDANNYSYLGLKIKVSGAYVEGLVEADKLVVIKLGNADKACKLKKNNSDYKSNLSGIPTTATAPAVHYGYDAAEKVYRFQTNGSGAVVLKAFEIIDPYEVTYDAETNGGTCATASVPFHADSLELPAASKDGASFLGWFDAASAGNKIGEAGDKIFPASAMTLYAQFLETAYVADLTDIQINSESVAGFDRAVISYNKEFAYGSAVPTITYTKAWDGATDVLSLPASLPGNATITVTSENGANVKVYTVHLTVGPKDGIAIISVEITNGNNSEQAVDANKISGFIGGTAVKKIQSGSTKLGSNGHYIGLTLASGSFQAGDKVNINVTTTNDASKVYFYKDAGTNAYETVERAMVVGDNWYDIPAAAIGQNSLYVYRVNDKCNPNVAKFEVYRPMNPVITAFALDGENGSIDEAKKRIVVSLPTDKSLTVDAEPTALTIVSNTDQASVVKSINGGGEWHYGDNTYRVTDKDGDYTEYTVRIYQQKRTGLVEGKMSTSCYSQAISMYRGVTFYELAGGYDVNIASDGDLNGSPTMLLFLEVETLEAGKPYLYVPTEDGVPLEVAFTGVEASEGNYRGFYGSFAGIAAAPDNILLNNFIVYNNIIQRCGENSYIGANRAYFKIEEVPCYSTKEAAYAAAEAAHGGSSPAPAMRRRLAVSNGGHTTPTGLDNISEDELTRLDGQKRIIDGKLFIIRDGHIYNAQGVRVQ